MFLQIGAYNVMVNHEPKHGRDRWIVLMGYEFGAGSVTLADVAFEPTEVMVRLMVKAYFDTKDAQERAERRERQMKAVRAPHAPFGSINGPIPVR